MSDIDLLVACGLTVEQAQRAARAAAEWAGEVSAHREHVLTRFVRAAALGHVRGADIEYLGAWPAVDRHLPDAANTVNAGRMTLGTLLDAIEKEMREP